MTILAIETATESCSVAFMKDDRLLGEFRLDIHRAHSEKLIPLIQDLSSRLAIELPQVNLIAISSGPGSFTGLRIGMSTAKGLAHALDCPLISVITLDALAFQANLSSGHICPLIKARQDEVYTTLFEKTANERIPQRIADYQVLSLNQLPDFIPENTFLIGNGVREFRTKLREIFKLPVLLAENQFSLLSAAATGFLGWQKFQANPVNELFELEPFYIQDFVVKRRKKTLV